MSRGDPSTRLTRPMALAFLTAGLGALWAFRRARALSPGGAATPQARDCRRLIAWSGLLFLTGLALSPTGFGLPLQFLAIAWYVHGWCRITAAGGA